MELLETTVLPAGAVTGELFARGTLPRLSGTPLGMTINGYLYCDPVFCFCPADSYNW
jgi:hypothetical protein